MAVKKRKEKGESRAQFIVLITALVALGTILFFVLLIVGDGFRKASVPKAHTETGEESMFMEEGEGRFEESEVPNGKTVSSQGESLERSTETSNGNEIEKYTPDVEDIKPVTPEKRLDYTFGISVAETLSVTTLSELERALDDIASLGVGWIRADLAWSTVQQRGEHEYSWEAFDRIVDAANERGIHVLPILTYTPSWARKDSCSYTKKCEPKNPDQFADFAYVAVQRYAPKGVTAWEIWNEPNMKLFWADGASAYRYTSLLKQTYHAIHEADPDAIVITGGLAPIGTGGGNVTALEFLEQMYESGAKEYFDALGFHPYSFPLGPSDLKKTNAWSQMSQTEWSLRSIMRVYGDEGKKIWITEYGAPTGGPGDAADSGDVHWWDMPSHVTEAYQATLLEDAVREARRYDWDGPLFWYSYKDLGIDNGTKENFFGLIRHDGSRKEAYYTLKTLLLTE